MEMGTGNPHIVAATLTHFVNLFYIVQTLFPLLFCSSLLILLTKIAPVNLIRLLICLFKVLNKSLFNGPISKLNIKYSANIL
jgi:hypothetical protein